MGYIIVTMLQNIFYVGMGTPRADHFGPCGPRIYSSTQPTIISNFKGPRSHDNLILICRYGFIIIAALRRSKRVLRIYTQTTGATEGSGGSGSYAPRFARR